METQPRGETCHSSEPWEALPRSLPDSSVFGGAEGEWRDRQQDQCTVQTDFEGIAMPFKPSEAGPGRSTCSREETSHSNEPWDELT